MKTSKLSNPAFLTSAKDLNLKLRPTCSLLQDALQRLWQSFVKSASGSQEPRIWQVRDRQGHFAWRVYDPMNRQSMSFASETEVRIWLEQRYRA